MLTIGRETVTEALIDANLEDEALYERYSGRGMYGEKCLGIVGNTADYSRFLLALAQQGDEGAAAAQEIAENVRSDSMGFDSIFYFPGVTIED